MAYSVQADVQNACGGLKRLTELFDWDNDGTADAAMITDCIVEADAMINSYAAKLFTIPLNPVTEIIKRVSAMLAKLIAAGRRGMMTHDEAKEWERLTGTDDKNPGWLLQLAKGIVTPGTDPMPTAHTTMATDQVSTEMPADRDNSREKLGGFW